MIEIIMDTLIDGLKLLPFLFLTFLIIELIEHKINNKNKELISKAGKTGPLIGGILGLLPQCGFSVMATNLYVTRIVSLGTLISIYLATSDEMLPVMLSSNADISIIIKILCIKFLIGMISGFIIDLILRKKEVKIDYEICDEDHCHCEKGVLISSIKHTLNTLLFIIVTTFILNILLETIGEENLSHILLKNSIFAPFTASLIGLIPNCGASVMITELYLSGIISFGTAISGLLTGSGVAILVLFKSNKNIRENLMILGIIYGIGSLSGVIIELIGMI